MDSVSVCFLEDDPDLGSILKQFVEGQGAQVTWVDSLNAMIQRRGVVLRSHFAFLDIDLGPGQPNGIDAFQWLRAENYSGQVFLTAHAQGHPLVEALNIEDIAVFAKPLSPHLLLQMIGAGES